MKNILLAIFAALPFQTAPVAAAEQCVTLGDSLTFAYEAEFGSALFSDGFGPEVRNWVEILHDPVYRHESFDQGSFFTRKMPNFLYDTLWLKAP